MHGMHVPKLYELNHHSPAQSGAEHGLIIYLRGPLNGIRYWTINILIITILLLTTLYWESIVFRI